MDPTHLPASLSTENCCIEKTVFENGILVTRFFCRLCNSSVGRKSDFQRHMRTHSDQGLFFCTWDGCTHANGFLQMSNLKLHIKHVHLCKRCRCPHLWRGADGKVFKCDHEASNPSSLIRHRSLKHGFDAGDDEKKAETPTPVGMTFRNSKYYRGSHAKSAKRPAGDDDSAKGPHPSRPAKRSKTTSAAPSAPRCGAPKKKPTRKTSAPNHTREQPVDFSSAHTSPASRSSPAESIPSPITAADWDIDLGSAEEQPAPSTNPATGPAAVSDTATPAPVDVPLNSESQTQTRTATAMNNWAFVPLVTDVTFTFTVPAVPVTLLVPPCNGTIDRDPRELLPTQVRVAVPVPVQPPPAYITARFASSSSSSSSSSSASASTPNVYGMGWQTQSYYPTPGSSRESTAPPAPRLSVFAGMPEWMPHAVPVSAPAVEGRAYNGFSTPQAL